MKLQELLKSRYEYNLHPDGDKDGDYEAVFTTDTGEKVEVFFGLCKSYGMYEVDFRRAGRWGLTGGGDALKIFGTVLAIIDRFIKELDPKGLFFSAAKNEESRMALYHRLVKRYTANGRYVDVTNDLGRLKNQDTREWFAGKIAGDEAYDELKLIVKREELGEPVQEALDTKIEYDIKTAEPRDFVATTEIDGKFFVFSATLDYGEDDYWEVGFAQKDPAGNRYFGITNRGSQFKVGAFVAAAFAEFLDRYAPLRVTFSVDGEESPEARSKLYDRIMKKHGFELIRRIGDDRMYDKV